MTLTNLLLRGVKSQFSADANRKTQELPIRRGSSFDTIILQRILCLGSAVSNAGG